MEEKKDNMEGRFFSSFEEEEQYRLQQVLKIPPMERIRQTVELILRTYGVTREQLNKRKYTAADYKIIYNSEEEFQKIQEAKRNSKK